MCELNNSFRVHFEFPFPTDVYGVDQLIPFKPLNSLRQRHNQIFAESPTYNNIQRYIDDLANNAYEDGDFCGVIENVKTTIREEIFGDKNEERWIENPDHVHFRKLGILDCLPLLLVPDHAHFHEPVDIATDTNFILDRLGSYCFDHNSISIDYEGLKQYLTSINAENNSDYSEYELLSIITNHEYGHYLTCNTSITLGKSDFVQVHNAAFQEIFAQLVCHSLIVRNGSPRMEELFKIILKNQPVLYHHYKDEKFKFLMDNPDYLPYFLFRARKIFAQANMLTLHTDAITIEQIIEIAPQNHNEIEELNTEILREIQENLSKAGVFEDKLSRNVGLDHAHFVGFNYCCTPLNVDYSEQN